MASIRDSSHRGGAVKSSKARSHGSARAAIAIGRFSPSSTSTIPTRLMRAGTPPKWPMSILSWGGFSPGSKSAGSTNGPSWRSPPITESRSASTEKRPTVSSSISRLYESHSCSAIPALRRGAASRLRHRLPPCRMSFSKRSAFRRCPDRSPRDQEKNDLFTLRPSCLASTTAGASFGV